MPDTAVPEPISPSLERSPGVLLRKAREQRGLHIAALAAAMKVTPRKLEALEGDRWDELPDATFARALAQSVCRTLKVEPKPVLDLMPPAAPAIREVAARNLNANYSGTPSRDVGGTGTASMRPLLIAAGLLVVAAAVMFALPASVWNGLVGAPAASAAVRATPERISPTAGTAEPVGLAPSSAPGASDAGAALVAAAASAPAPFGAAAVDAAASSAVGTADAVAAQALATQGRGGEAGPGGATVMAVGVVAGAGAGAGALSAASPASQAAAAKLAAKAASAAAGMPQNPNAALQVLARKSTWLTVKDGRNRLLIDSQVPAGVQIGLDGQGPLSVVIGNAAGTQVQYKGQIVDIAARARGNVARFDLP